MAWAHVANDGAGDIGTNVSSFAVTWTSDTTVGNRAFILVSIWINGTAPTISSITDPRGNSWNADKTRSFVDGTFNGRVEVWSAQIATKILATDSLTVNLTGGANSGGSFGTLEYSGLDTSSTPVDVSIAADSGGTATTSVASGNTAATNAANEMVLRVYSDDGYQDTWSAAPAGTARINRMNNATGELWTSDQDSGSSGSTPGATGTLTANAANWAVMTVVYKLAGGVLAPSHPIHAYGAN